MGRFIFRLQPVLEQRERIEDEHQRMVAEIERERVRLEASLREIQASMDEAKGSLRSELGSANGSVMVRDVRFQAGAAIALFVQAQAAALELAGCYRRLERARAELLKATSDRKAVQLLKDRRYEEWKREQARRDMLATDEVGTTGYMRRMAEERVRAAASEDDE